MTQVPTSQTFQHCFLFKIQDLEIWYNPTVFSSISALIRIQTLQFPLLTKETSQGKLKLKNKPITSLQCYYDTRKHKYLPLKIQVDLTLEYKGGKSHVKRFMINLNEFKTGANKTQRIKVFKSVQRMFSVEIIFKLEDGINSNNHIDASHSTFKNESRSGFSSYHSNEISALRHVRIPKTQNHIQQVRSLNTKESIKSPKRMSDFISPTKKNPYKDHMQTINANSNKQKVITSPNANQNDHYMRHLENGTSSEEVKIKHGFVSYMQGDPYIAEEHKIYATIKPSEIGQTQNSVEKITGTISHNVTESNHSINAQKPDFCLYRQNGQQKPDFCPYRQNGQQKPSEIGQTQNSVEKITGTISHKVTESNHSINAQKPDFFPYRQNGQQNDSYRQVSSPQKTLSSRQLQEKEMNFLLVDEVKDLRKKLSDLLYEKNNLHAEKQRNLLEYETKDKEQKIRHRKELMQQKKYFEELLRRRDLELEELRDKWSQTPTEIKDYNRFQHYQMQTVDDSSERNLSISFEQSTNGKHSFADHARASYENNLVESYEAGRLNNQKDRKRIFETTPIFNSKSPTHIVEREKDQKNVKGGHNDRLVNKDKTEKNDLSEMSEIESTRNMIIRMKEELSQKDNKIADLLKYKQLAHDQELSLRKLNELIDQLNLVNQEPENNIPSTKPIQKLENSNPNNANSGKIQLRQSIDELEEICAELSNHIELLEEKIKFLEQTNTALNEDYAKKMAEIQGKQHELEKKQHEVGSKKIELQNERERLKELEQKANKQNSSLKVHSQTILNKNEELAFKDKQLTQKSNQINELNGQLKHKDEQLQEYSRQIEQLDSVIGKLNSKVNELIETNSKLHTHIESLQRQLQLESQQQIVLHNYHLNPQNDEMLYLEEQNDWRQKNGEVVKIPSIVRVERAQSKPQKPSTHESLMKHNQNKLNIIQGNESNYSRRNNYHQSQMDNSQLESTHAHPTHSVPAIVQQSYAYYERELPSSQHNPQHLQRGQYSHTHNANYQPAKPNSKPHTPSPSYKLEKAGTTQLIRIEDTPKHTSHSPKQYSDLPAKLSQQNTPRPNKITSNITPKTYLDVPGKQQHKNYQIASINSSKNDKNKIQQVYHSAQKQLKGPSPRGRSYRSTRNQRKRTRSSDDSDGYGCC